MMALDRCRWGGPVWTPDADRRPNRRSRADIDARLQRTRGEHGEATLGLRELPGWSPLTVPAIVTTAFRGYDAAFSGFQNDDASLVSSRTRRDLTVAAGPLGERSNLRSLDGGFGMTKPEPKSSRIHEFANPCKGTTRDQCSSGCLTPCWCSGSFDQECIGRSGIRGSGWPSTRVSTLTRRWVPGRAFMGAS